MYDRPLVPPTFIVPERVEFEGGLLRMLSIDDLEMDFAAVTESRDRLKGLLDPDSPWPEGLTKKEDLIDLAWHQREFTLRHSFAYTLVAPDESSSLGCCYIFPSNVPDIDAAVFLWVRSGPDADRRDAEFARFLKSWLAAVWPFEAIAFPGRDIPWPQWRVMNGKT